MSTGADIGTLSGRIEFEDRVTSTLDILNEKISGLESRFGGLDHTVKHTAEGFLLAEVAMKAVEKAIDITVDVIRDFTTEGARIADVEQNFERLAEGAGRLSSTLMNELRQGTHNTITDFELMKSANAALAAGVNITDQQYRQLSTGAFALAQSKGMDVKQTFDLINDAMVTGQTRGLRSLDIRIDQTKAEQDFAASLGTTADQLSAAGKQEASRAAILQEMANATGRLGEQTDGLDEIIEQAQTAMKNFYEDLIKTAATSPSVITAFTTVRDSLVAAFGGDSQSLLETFIGWINNIADAVTEYAPSVINAFMTIKQFVVDFYHGAVEAWSNYGPILIGGFTTIRDWILTVYHEVVDTWTALPDWLKTVTERTALTAVGLTLLGQGASMAASGITDFISTAGNLTTALSGLPNAIANVTGWLGSLKLLAGVTALEFTSFAAAKASMQLLAGSIASTIGPLGIAVAYAALLYGAFELGKWEPVSDFFQDLGLRIMGYSEAERTAMIATDHATQAAQAQSKELKQQADASAMVKSITEQLKAATDATAQATHGSNEEFDRSKMILGQTAEEAKKYAEALKEMNSVGGDWKKVLTSIDGETVDAIKYYLDAGVSLDKLTVAYGLTDTQAQAIQRTWKEQNDTIKTQIQAATELGDAWNDYYKEVAALTATDLEKADQASLAKYDAIVKKLQDLGVADQQYYDQAWALYKKDVELNQQSLIAKDTQSKTFLESQLTAAKQRYDMMIQHSNEYRQVDIENQRKVIQSLQAMKDGWNQVGEQTVKATKLVVGYSDAVMEANRIRGGTQDYDLTTREGVEGFRKLNPGASITWSDEQIIAFAKKGGTLAQLIKMGVIDQYAGMKSGNQMPSFSEGGVGDFGSGTLAMLHGKEAIVPLDKGIMGGVNLTFHVNGTGAQVGRQAADHIMQTLNKARWFGGSR